MTERELTERMVIVGAVAAVLSGIIYFDMCNECLMKPNLIGHLREHVRSGLVIDQDAPRSAG